jgi:hypothetical protein
MSNTMPSELSTCKSLLHSWMVMTQGGKGMAMPPPPPL